MNEPMIHLAGCGDPEVTAVNWRNGMGQKVAGAYVRFADVAFLATESAEDLRAFSRAIDDAALELDRQHMDGDVNHDGCRHRTVRQIGRKCLRCWQWEADRIMGDE